MDLSTYLLESSRGSRQTNHTILHVWPTKDTTVRQWKRVCCLITEITNLRPGLLIIHGSPRRPQMQGCVERANGDLQIKLGKWLDEHGGTWSSGLRYVTHTMNTSTASATKTTPYEVVFGQRPRQDFYILQQLATQGPLVEENIDETLLQTSDSNQPDQNTPATKLRPTTTKPNTATIRF